MVTTSGAAAPTGSIAAGQAFFFKASTGSNIVFTNGMRIPGDNTQFFKTSQTAGETNRLWLNLTNAEGAFKQALIGYVDGATNSWDQNYDAATLNGNTYVDFYSGNTYVFKQALIGYVDGATNSWDQNYDAATLNGNTYVDFYSISDAKKLTVQGRALPFENTDLIPLGYKTAVAGEFTIAIDHTDGLLNNQAVYLEDKTTGIIYDLKAGNYKFTTAIGTFTDRFVLRYTNKTLGTGDFENVKDGLLVSVKDKVIKVTSSKENIKEVSVFEKVGTTELSISNLQAADQVLLVKVTLENKAEVTRKIIFK
nr:T9SS C-terminal target domain-containing protein [Flavobacterium sp. Root186]